MDLVTFLIMLVVFAVVFWLAAWIIKQTLPGDVQKIALVVLGVIALLVLLGFVAGYFPVPRVFVTR